MKIKISKFLSLSLVAMLASAMFVGCSSDDTSTSTADTATPEVVVPENPPMDAPTDAPADDFVEGIEPPAMAEGPLVDTAVALLDNLLGEGAGGMLMSVSDAAFIKDMLSLDLPEEVVADFVYSTPMMNTNYQTFFAITANEGQVEAAEAILAEYRDAEILRVGPPDPYAHIGQRYLKAQAAQIVTIGDTVYYIAMGDEASLGDEPTIENLQEHAQNAVDILMTIVEGGADAIVADGADLTDLPVLDAAGDMGVGNMTDTGEMEHLGDPIPAGDMEHLGDPIAP